MKHGDLSNHVKATFGFMCEDFVLEFRDDTFIDKVCNTLFGKLKRAEVNVLAVKAMEHIFRNTEYTADLLIQEKNYEEIKPLISDLPFCRIVLYNKYSQIASRLLTGDLTYVVDSHKERMSLINNPHVIDLDTLSQMTRR